MNRDNIIASILIGAVALGLSAATTASSQSIDPWVVGSGGGEASSAGHVINGTITQTADIIVTSASNEIDQGFWPEVGLRGTIAHASGTIWEVIGGGGGEASSAGHVVNGTIAQTADIVVTSASNEIAQGFWQGEPDLPLYRVVTHEELVPSTPSVSETMTGARRSSLSVAPEPVNGMTTVTVQAGIEGNGQLRLFDPAGALVGIVYDGWISSGRTTLLLDGSKLPAGSYFLSLEINGQREVARRIVIVR